MKPKVLMNEKYRAKINALYALKKQMQGFDCFAIESMKYDLDVNRPLQPYDFTYLAILDKKYGRLS